MREEDDQARSKPAIPKQTEALVEFFETHDMGEYWEELPEAKFDIDLKEATASGRD